MLMVRRSAVSVARPLVLWGVRVMALPRLVGLAAASIVAPPAPVLATAGLAPGGPARG
jgi:hypothetical protein